MKHLIPILILASATAAATAQEIDDRQLAEGLRRYFRIEGKEQRSKYLARLVSELSRECAHACHVESEFWRRIEYARAICPLRREAAIDEIEREGWAAFSESERERDGEVMVHEEIRWLARAIDTFAEDWLRYPPSESTGEVFGTPLPRGERLDQTTALFLFLDGDKDNGGPRSPYFPFQRSRVRGLTYLDPWGDPYRYRRFDPPREGHLFEVWSTGGGERRYSNLSEMCEACDR